MEDHAVIAIPLQTSLSTDHWAAKLARLPTASLALRWPIAQFVTPQPFTTSTSQIISVTPALSLVAFPVSLYTIAVYAT